MRTLFRRFYYFNRQGLKRIFNKFSQKHRLLVMEANSWPDVAQLWRYLLEAKTQFPTIRLGGLADGGYCVPAVLESVECFFSPGYGGVKEFEDELSDMGIPSFICDGSFSDIPDLRANQAFDSKNLATWNGAETMTLDHWIENSGFSHSQKIGVQMDIEGAEYSILDSLEPKTLKSISILLIEFHELDLLLVSQSRQMELKRILEKIFKTHDLVHTKANNAGGVIHFCGTSLPLVMELSFVRKGIGIDSKSSQNSFYCLNCEFLNDYTKPEIKLPKLEKTFK